MLSNSALLIVVVLTIAIAQFSPLTALLISIALCAGETAYLYIDQACNLD